MDYRALQWKYLCDEVVAALALGLIPKFRDEWLCSPDKSGLRLYSLRSWFSGTVKR